MKRWTQSWSGNVVTLLDLQPEQVRFEDIAPALAQKVRFQGASRFPVYSVAQHCVLGARVLPPAFQLPFLLHEVSEVYLPDIPGPIKSCIHVATPQGAIPWAELEARHADAVLTSIGLRSLLPLLTCEEVKVMDWAMLAAEKEQLLRPPPEPWDLPHPAANVVIEPWTTQRAHDEWINLFRYLSTV